jgi:crossover junction endodeoxyribonuclease RuvC
VIALGIDPGRTGGIVVLEQDLPMPSVLAALPLDDVDLSSPALIEDALRGLPRPTRVAIELGQSPRAPGGAMGSAPYQTGVRWGHLHAVASLVWRGIPIWTPTPQRWQTILADVSGEGKARAIAFASQRLPGLDLTPGRRRRPHDGIADAACIALWATERRNP